MVPRRGEARWPCSWRWNRRARWHPNRLSPDIPRVWYSTALWQDQIVTTWATSPYGGYRSLKHETCIPPLCIRFYCSRLVWQSVSWMAPHAETTRPIATNHAYKHHSARKLSSAGVQKPYHFPSVPHNPISISNSLVHWETKLKQASRKHLYILYLPHL